MLVLTIPYLLVRFLYLHTLSVAYPNHSAKVLFFLLEVRKIPTRP